MILTKSGTGIKLQLFSFIKLSAKEEESIGQESEGDQQRHPL